MTFVLCAQLNQRCHACHANVLTVPLARLERIRSRVADTTATAVVASGGTVAWVFLDWVVWDGNRSTAGVVPFTDQNSVTLSINTGGIFLSVLISECFLVARESSPFLPLTVFLAGLFVHGIV